MTRLQDRFDQAKQISTPDLSDELLHRLNQDPHPVEAGRNPIGQRVLVGAVALIIFLVAGAFAWRAFRPGTAMTAPSAPSAPSDVLQVQCDANSVQVSTPVVAAQAQLQAYRTRTSWSGRPEIPARRIWARAAASKESSCVTCPPATRGLRARRLRRRTR